MPIEPEPIVDRRDGWDAGPSDGRNFGCDVAVGSFGFTLRRQGVDKREDDDRERRERDREGKGPAERCGREWLTVMHRV